MSIRIKSVCLNQPSDSFLYISSFCPPLYSRSPPPRKIFFREILRLSSSKVRHIYYIGLYNIILHLQDQVKCHICQKQTFFAVRCQSLSLVWKPLRLRLRHSHLPFQWRLWIFFSCSLLTSSSFIMRYISLINLSYSSLIFCFEYFPPSG